AAGGGQRAVVAIGQDQVLAAVDRLVGAGEAALRLQVGTRQGVVVDQGQVVAGVAVEVAGVARGDRRFVGEGAVGVLGAGDGDRAGVELGGGERAAVGAGQGAGAVGVGNRVAAGGQPGEGAAGEGEVRGVAGQVVGHHHRGAGGHV